MSVSECEPSRAKSKADWKRENVFKEFFEFIRIDRVVFFFEDDQKLRADF